MKIAFVLDISEQIEIVYKGSLYDKESCCMQGRFYFKGKKLSVLLKNDFLYEGLVTFISMLKKAVVNELKLHNSLTEDLGYMWSKKLHGETDFVKNKNGLWVGQLNLLWNTSCDNELVTTTWLYNDDQGKIILKITPTYVWKFDDPVTGNDLKEHDNFLQNYQPILSRVISTQIAKQWLAKSQNLLEQIDAKLAKAKHSCE